MKICDILSYFETIWCQIFKGDRIEAEFTIEVDEIFTDELPSVKKVTKTLKNCCFVSSFTQFLKALSVVMLFYKIQSNSELEWIDQWRSLPSNKKSSIYFWCLCVIPIYRCPGEPSHENNNERQLTGNILLLVKNLLHSKQIFIGYVFFNRGFNELEIKLRSADFSPQIL